MKSILRIIIQRFLLGVDRIVPTKGVPVLLYHETRSDNIRNGIPNVDLNTFNNQMKYLYKHGYKTLSSSDISNIVSGEIDLPSKSCVISFDDGFKSNIGAFEIMKQYGYKGICFVASAFIGKSFNYMPYWLSSRDVDYTTSSNKDCPFEFMSEEDLEYVTTLGNIEIAPHTNNHIDMISFEDEEINEDLGMCENRLFKFSPEIKVISYPRGLFDDRVKGLLKSRKYSLAYGVFPGVITANSDALALPRSNVPKESLMFKLILTDKIKIYSAISNLLNRH